ncbi:MAG: ankyrin repeat domain-containing protein [Vicinamibacterales bacterium]
MRTVHIGLVLVLSAVGLPSVAAASDLVDAVRAGDRAAVMRLLTDGADVQAPEADGSTALHWAARGGDGDMVARLLAAGAKPDVPNRLGVTPLALAVAGADSATIDALIRAGGNPAAASEEGETLLMTAAEAGNLAAVRTLLAHGADPNAAESWQGQTALMWAAGGGHADIVTALLEAGARPDVQATMLPGQPRLPRGQGVAIQAAHSNFPKGGLAALHFAAREGAIDAARALVDGGANLDITEPDGLTPLYMAIINAHFDLAAMLVERGANVNQADRVGRTPLFMTVDANTMEWLFSRPIPRASGELTAMDLARRLIAAGADVNARLTGRPFILHHNATGNRNIQEGATPFFRASTTSDLPMMQLLLDAGADPTITTTMGTTPLMVLAGLNWVDIASLGREQDSLTGIELLLARGADVNAANSLGETAAHGAAQRGADRVMQLLADRGAVLDQVNREGRTPMDEARGQTDTSAEDNVRRPERKSTLALLETLLAARGPRDTPTP